MLISSNAIQARSPAHQPRNRRPKLSQSLKPGENTTINQPKGQVLVAHSAGANLDVNLTAFLVTDTGKVIDDSGMVFFNAPEHASGAAAFSPPINQAGTVSHSISFDLGVVCGRGRNPTLRLWPTIFSGKIDVFRGDRRSRLISSMTSVAPA
ncbi:TerD family protein (plasmid) [Pseudomonas aeruginosa]